MNSNTPQQNKSTRSWLIAGIVFLFVLALTSAIDASLFYIFLGVTAFCFFMAMRGWISTQPWKRDESGYQRQKTSEGFSFEFKFGESEKKQQQYQQPKQQQSSQPGTQKVPRAVIIAFMAIVGFFVFIVIIGSLLGSDDEMEVQYYRDQAELFLDNQQYDSARVHYRRVIKRRPDDVPARVGYGKSFYFQEQYDSAIALFNAANEVEPEDLDARVFRGRCYYYQKKYPEAMNEAEQLLADAPGYNEAMLLAGDVLYAQEKFEEALTTYYQPAYDAGARSMMLCWLMAYIYDEKKKDIETAIPLYKEALTYDNTVADIYSRLSQITQEPEAGEYRLMLEKIKRGN
jgi:tetratricopeptide (TPR) repeat protein